MAFSFATNVRLKRAGATVTEVQRRLSVAHMSYKGPALAVDCVVFDGAGRLLLVRRKHAPFAGQYALPGGFAEKGETVEAAALRELKEETGVDGDIVRLVGVYSDPGRDPRGHTVSVAFLVRTAATEALGGDDADAAEFVGDWRDLKLAFDHNVIVTDALAHATAWIGPSARPATN